MADPKQARRFFISGLVQGVGFRYFSQDIAERLHLCGYARNLTDGRVEVYAIGTSDQLRQLHSALERGPSSADVTGVQEEPAPIDPRYAHEFVITFH